MYNYIVFFAVSITSHSIPVIFADSMQAVLFIVTGSAFGGAIHTYSAEDGAVTDSLHRYFYIRYYIECTVGE